MKTAVIFFHKNIRKIYQQKWIDICVDSVLNQSYKDFDIFEVNYGNEDYSVLENKNSSHSHYFFKRDFSLHIEGMIFLLNKCFVENNYDVVFNTNLDDWYMEERFQKQKDFFVKHNDYLLCSSNWNYIRNDKILLKNKIKDRKLLKIKVEENYINLLKKYFIRNHNVINHSGVAFTRKFWYSKDKNGNYLRYREDKPYEDLTLWKRTLFSDHKIFIIPESLINYRLHSNQITEEKKTKLKEVNERIGVVIFKENLNEVKKKFKNYHNHIRYFSFHNENIKEDTLDTFYFKEEQYEEKKTFIEMMCDKIVSTDKSWKKSPLEFFYKK